MTADIDIHTVSTADHTDPKLLLAVKPIEEFSNVSNLLCVCEQFEGLDRCSASQLATINPISLLPAVYRGAACETLQRCGGVWRESRVHR